MRTTTSTRARTRRWLLLPVAAATAALAACVPPPTPTDPTTPWLEAGCIDSSLPGVPDFLFSGVANEFENATAFFVDEQGTYSDDGSCTGEFGEEKGTILRAVDSAAAAQLCDDLGIPDITNPARLTDFGYEAPIDAWTCENAPAAT